MNRIVRMLILGIKKLREPYYHGFAAQIAFYYMLSLVPISLILTQMLGRLFPDQIEGAVDWIFSLMGGSVADSIKDLFSFRSAGAFNIVYLVIALWAASRGQFALTRIINYTMTDGRTTGRGFLVERIRSVGTMFLLLVAIVLSIGVLVYGGIIVEIFFPKLDLWLYLRWPVAIVLFGLILSFIYYILPIKRPRFRDVLPGSIAAALVLVLVNLAYSYYLTSIARYDIIYGALASIVALMFWFYFLAWVLCLGVVFNKVLQETKPEPEPA